MSGVSIGAAALADAIRQQAVQAGQDSPQVRGADWRTAIVATVGTDGTVTTSDGIVARRLESYTGPTVGDRIIVTISGNGNWLACGRTATGGDTVWTIPSLTTGYTHDGNGNGTLQYRTINRGGRYIEFRGGVNVPASVGMGASAIFVLPAAARPTFRRSIPVAKNGEAYKVDINTNGNVSLVSGPGSAWSWVAINGTYPLD